MAQVKAMFKTTCHSIFSYSSDLIKFFAGLASNLWEYLQMKEEISRQEASNKVSLN